MKISSKYTFYKKAETLIRYPLKVTGLELIGTYSVTNISRCAPYFKVLVSKCVSQSLK